MSSTKSEIDHANEGAQRERSLQMLAENAKWLNAHRERAVRTAASVRQVNPIDHAPKVKTLADSGQSPQ